MTIHMTFGESRPAFTPPTGTATFPEGTENPTPIDPRDLKAWVERKIAFEKEAGDPDNYVDGLQYLLRTLKIRERCDPNLPSTPHRPVLDGTYNGADGVGDAITALVMTMLTVRRPNPTWHVKVWES